MRIHNIYADENGETHFRDIDIEMSEHGPDGSTSGRLAATGIYFRTTPADWFFGSLLECAACTTSVCRIVRSGIVSPRRACVPRTKVHQARASFATTD
jgi:hypothetical protein